MFFPHEPADMMYPNVCILYLHFLFLYYLLFYFCMNGIKNEKVFILSLCIQLYNRYSLMAEMLGDKI